MESTWNSSEVEDSVGFRGNIFFPRNSDAENDNEIFFPHNGDPGNDSNEKLVSGNGNGIDECPSEGDRQFPFCRFPFYYQGRYRFECVNRTEDKGAECLFNDEGGKVSAYKIINTQVSPALLYF